MRINSLKDTQKEELYGLHLKQYEYLAKIIEFALALHIYAGFKMLSATRILGNIKEVYAFDVSNRIYTFKGPGRTVLNNKFENVRPIDEDSVRAMYPGIDNLLIEMFAKTAQALWPSVSWNAKSNLKKVSLFANEFAKLCKTHSVLLKTTSPEGVTIRPVFEGDAIALTNTDFSNQLASLCKAHDFSLRTTSPEGILLDVYDENLILSLSPSLTPGEFHIEGSSS